MINGPAVLAAVIKNGRKVVDGVQVVPESVLQPLVDSLEKTMPENGSQGDNISARLQSSGRRVHIVGSNDPAVEIPGHPPADDEPPRGDSREEGEIAMALVATGFQ